MSNIANELLSSSITSFEVTKADGTTLTCYQRDLSAGDVLDFVHVEEGPKRNEALLRLVSLAIVEEDGTAVFSGTDIGQLRDMPVKIFQQLSDAVVKAAGLEEVEEDEGN